MLLQRGRAPECTEREKRMRCGSMDWICFNGAVHRSARRALCLAGSGPEGAELQRGRAPECTESSCPRADNPRIVSASTGPCTGVHGEVELSAQEKRRVNASTGPCTGVHGEFILVFRVSSAALASTGPCTGVHGEQEAKDLRDKRDTLASTGPCTGVHGERFLSLRLHGL